MSSGAKVFDESRAAEEGDAALASQAKEAEMGAPEAAVLALRSTSHCVCALAVRRAVDVVVKVVVVRSESLTREHDADQTCGSNSLELAFPQPCACSASNTD